MKTTGGRPGRARPLLASLSLLATASLLASTDAAAITGWPSDCAGLGDERTTFNPGDPVCVTGELDVIPPDEFVCAAGWTSIIPFGADDPFGDVSRGGANYVLGCAGAGAFFDEVLWLPPLMPGHYEITIDQYPFYPETGVFGPEDYRVPDSFTVTNAPVVFSVDVDAIKRAAEDGLRFAESIELLTKFLTAIDTLATAADWAGEFGPWGGAAGLLLGFVCYRTHTECPTSYDSAVIGIGNHILEGIAHQQSLHYASIIADPPDPAYDVVVGLDAGEILALGAPFAPGAARDIPEHQIAIAQLAAIQAVAAGAILPTLEKLQGADADGSNAGRMIQAEKLQAYAALSLAAGDAMMVELDALETFLTSSGALQTTYDVAGAIAELQANGPGDEGRALTRSLGFDDQTTDAALAELTALDVPPEVSWASLIAATRGAASSMHDALTDLAAQAEQVRAENEPYALRLSPRVSIAGAAVASVGQAVALTASAEHWNANAAMTWGWDTDLDGSFDDGAAAALSFTPTAPGRTLVAARATDPDGRADVALHVLEVAATNAPPEITTQSPPEPAPFADVGETVDLQVEVADPDGDSTTVAWRVDGTAQGEGPTLSFTMPDEEPHWVQVTVADDDPYSRDAVATWVVRAARWEGQTGEGGDGDADADADGDGGPGGGDGDGDGGSRSSGCSCRAGASPAGPTAAGLAFVAVVLALTRKRRPRP